MKKLIYILITNCLLLIVNCYAQSSITWNRLYNGYNTYKDYGDDICSADNGNFYLVGTSLFLEPTGKKIYLLKINSYGDTLWTKYLTVNGGGAEAYRLLQTPDGGCLITGYSSCKFLLRVDSSGNVQWEYVSQGYSSHYGIALSINNDYVCSGIMSSGEGGSVFRTTSTGGYKWEKVLPGFYFQEILPTEDNGCLVSGYTGSNSACIVKLDSNGTVVWTGYYNVQGQWTRGGGNFTKDGNKYILTGHTWNGYKNIPFFIRLNQNLVALDTHLILPVKQELLERMEVIRNNRYVWTLYFENIADTSFNRFLVTDSTGQILAEKIKYTVSTTQEDNRQEFLAIKPVMNGDIIFVGSARYQRSNANWDVSVIRTDSNLNFPSNIFGIQQNNNQFPMRFALHQNYPNPFNPATKIRFDIPSPKGARGMVVRLIIYDILGIEIIVLVNRDLKPGTYEVDWDGTNYPSGVYFYTLSADNFTETRKMVLIK